MWFFSQDHIVKGWKSWDKSLAAVVFAKRKLHLYLYSWEIQAECVRGSGKKKIFLKLVIWRSFLFTTLSPASR